MTRPRSAILGCGPRADYHARVYGGVKSGSLEACCDLNEERLHTFGDRFGIESRFTDLQTMMKEVRPDLLHIVTAPTVRWSVVEEALRHPPRAVLIEKPLACRPEEAKRIFDACKDAGVAVFVNHQLRHHMPNIEMREVVRSGELGEIEWVRASSRGNLLEQGTHLFDLVSFLFDDRPMEWVLAQATGHHGFEGSHSCPYYAVGTLALEGGVHVSFECGSPAPVWRSEPQFWFNIGVEVVGTKGRAGASINHGWWLHAGSTFREDPVPYPGEDDRAQQRLIDSILKAIAGGEELIKSHPNNAERSAISFNAVMAAQLSALYRRPIQPGAIEVTDAEIEQLREKLMSSEGVTDIV